MGELLEIAAALRNFSGLTQWYGLTDHDMLPTDDLFFALAPQPVLEKQIGECIISPEEMADTASVTLRDLRRKIRATEDSIRTKLDAIIKNSTTNKFLQDAVVSLRNGRFVVPVKAKYRGEVGGVIHDVSSTGATVFVEPTAVVEAVDPIVLDTRVDDGCKPRCCECGLTEIPAFIARSFGEELVFDDGGRRRFYVTLGQFTLVRLERDTQLLVPVYDYCMPDKECACGDGCEDPCALFRNISFPVGEFFPPNTVKRPESCDDIKSCCK